MNRMISFVLFLLAAFHVSAQQETIVENHTVKEVTIYLDRAMVLRTGATTIQPGRSTIIFEGLSSQIIPQSVSVAGRGDFTILSVNTQLNYLNPETKSKQYLMLEDSLEWAKMEFEKIKNRREAFQDELAMVNANKEVRGENVGLKAEDLQKVADFFRSRITEIKNNISELVVREKKAKERLDMITRQIGDLNQKRNIPTSRILVNVDAKTRQQATFELNYIATGAGWEPFYNIRFVAANQPLKLEYKGSVYQSTGENWENTNLTLSTGRPSEGGNKPELYAWYLNFIQPYMNQTRALKSEEIQSAPARQEMEDATAGNLAEFTNVVENMLNTSFEIKIPYSIPSDGKKYLVDIQSHNIPATYNYAAVPKLDRDVFLTAMVTDWNNLNLLPGPAHVYTEGTFTGETFINPATTNDTLTISLGRDKRITVTREQLKDVTGNQFIGSNKVLTRKYEITLKNNKKEAVEIWVEDQVPVSKQKDIDVKVNDYSGAEYNPDTGKLLWKLNIPPGGTVKKTFEFTVKYPKDKYIQGL
ncbi:MAG: DUF4139 domain-containing protein [Bacteroidia bacterium]